MSYSRSQTQVLEETNSQGGKDVYMKGLFIQGDVRNHNQRVYPAKEISRAVSKLSKEIIDSNGIPGQLDHPPELSINLDRISHLITEIWVDGSDGYGKLKLMPTPMGNIAKVLIESGMRLGVSSRGSGNVDDNGIVSDFDIITVDIVAQPSAPNAYPRVIYESLYNMKGGPKVIEETARYAHTDKSAEKQLFKDISRFMNELKI